MGNLTQKIKKSWKDILIVILLVLTLGAVLTDGANNMYYQSKSLSMDNVGYTESMNYVRGGGMSYNDDFAPEEINRKIIKNADLNLKSDNYDYTKTQIQASINAHNVIVLNNNENKYRDDYRRISYTFKVEASKVELLVDELKNYGEIQSLNIYANDVTGSYVDYNERLDRYSSQIIKYQDMLNKKDLSIEEEVKIQTRVDQLEDQIFYLKKNIGSINEDVSYSTVQLSVTEKPSVWSEIDFLGFKDGFKMFMESLEAGVQFILMILGFILPFGLIYGIYRVIRRLI